MPVTTSYPGLYIEEVPLSAHTITPAPTSITVFVGYTHPYKTKSDTNDFLNAVRIFSFADYEREFGGFFASDLIPTDVPDAVNQFFLNGGSDAYVVGLEPQLMNAGVSAGKFTDPDIQPTAKVPAVGTGVGLVFTAREPIDVVGMKVTISNVRASTGTAKDTFDVVITYGTRVESYRNLQIASAAATISAASSLVTVDHDTNGFGSELPGKSEVDFTQSLPPHDGVFSASDYITAFKEDGSLDKIPIFNILVVPGVTDAFVTSTALSFAERKRAFMILDPEKDAAADGSDAAFTAIEDLIDDVPKSQNGAIYFPYLTSTNAVTGKPKEIAPSGFVAGIFAREDVNRGVWKAPAGLETTVRNTTGVVPRGRMTDQRHGVLNTAAINCLRTFPGIGTVVFGARTLVAHNEAFAQSKYVPVRRMTLFLEQTLLANLRWVVFEPNDAPLWLAIRISIEGFMTSLFNQGALQGSKASDAFQVKCDATTTSPNDIANGIVNIVVAFAPLRPAEFVIIKIAQLAGQSQAA
jgi:phage tail sheath protein FI